jgi:predicted DNA-binding transcriptional regulator AlpA
LRAARRSKTGAETVTKPKPAEAEYPTSKARKTPPRQHAPMHRVAYVDAGDNLDPPASRPTQYIFKAEVLRRVGYTYPSIWRWMREGTFPLSFDVGSKTAWREDEVEAWLANRPRSNLKKREG